MSSIQYYLPVHVHLNVYSIQCNVHYLFQQLIFSVDDEEGCDPPLRESELPDHVEEEETANPTHGEKEECSDDEVVFEAYVSPSEVVADQDEDGLPDEDLKV